MSSLFKAPSVPRPPKPPTRTTQDVQRAEELERRRRSLAAGRASTILTQRLGRTTGAISRKTLLGE